jgi:hypothetical protein
MTQLEGVEARLIALEMLFRGMLHGIVLQCRDPIADIERMHGESHSTVNFLHIGGPGVGNDHAERMRELITARVDETFAAIRNRLLRDVEIEAAQAGAKN